MHAAHILASLRRHKAFSILIVLEVAVCCAILCNAMFYVSGRIERMRMQSGLAEDEVVRIRPVDTQPFENPDALADEDLAALRSIPGVKYAAQSSMIPLSESDSAIPIRLHHEDRNPVMHATVYYGDRHLLDAMGLTLVRGRRFTSEDEVVWPYAQDNMPTLPQAIIARGLAEQLFPGQDPVGKTFFGEGAQPVRVIGVVEYLKRGYVLGKQNGFDNSVMFPVRAAYSKFYGHYLIRTRPEMRQVVLDTAVARLTANYRKRVMFSKDTFEEIRAGYFRKDAAMTWALIAVCTALMAVTAFGIIGISSFWVSLRARHIGIRRALGATKAWILGYFLLENLILVGTGIVAGVALAYAINGLLMSQYEFARLPAGFVALGAVMIVVVGQLSVLQPAAKAAALPVAEALRDS